MDILHASLCSLAKSTLLVKTSMLSFILAQFVVAIFHVILGFQWKLPQACPFDVCLRSYCLGSRLQANMPSYTVGACWILSIVTWCAVCALVSLVSPFNILVYLNISSFDNLATFYRLLCPSLSLSTYLSTPRLPLLNICINVTVMSC